MNLPEDTLSIATGTPVVGNNIDVDLTLDGAAVSGGVASFAVSVQLIFTIDVLDAGGGGQIGTFHITGELDGNLVTEDVSFTNDNTFGQTCQSINSYDSVSLINFTMMSGPDALLRAGNLAGGSAQGEFIDLSWTEATAGTFPIAQYRLFRGVNGGAMSLLTTVAAESPRVYTDMDVIGDLNTYAYEVIVRDTSGLDSVPSNVVILPFFRIAEDGRAREIEQNIDRRIVEEL